MPNRVRVLVVPDADPGGAGAAGPVEGRSGPDGGAGPDRAARELTAAIGAFVDHWNEHPRLFAWTKDADEILSSINHAKTKTNGLTDH